MNYDDLVLTFGSKLKADEVLYLINGIKPVIRQLFFEAELEKVEDLCQKNKLFLVKAPFKVLFLDAEQTFSNKGQRVPLNDVRKGAFVCYISFNEKQANLAALAELQLNDKSLGKLLGYPNCCINYFQENFALENPNPVLGEQSTKIQNSWMLDISRRSEDLEIISHFPCSWNCEKSVEIACNRLNLLNEINPKRYHELKCLREIN